MCDECENVLGPVEERDAQKPRCSATGEYEGGTAFERSPHAHRIDAGGRCYTLPQSYQVTRNLTGPTVGAKIFDRNLTDHHKQRQRLCKV